ncbi:MAG: transposase [Clostridia bacterium]|nr:transposase [Clostridia bacterium]
MPRYSRKKSATNIYHVILRGINHQEIFYDTQDYQKFLKEINHTKEEYQYELYAFVLMNNHVHLLIYDKKQCLSNIIHNLAIRYSLYFNKKYKRCGHLFQNRFLSKEVESESYLLNLQRYIHQNPVKEKIGKIETYQWSSYQDYIGRTKNADTEFILALFHKEKKQAIKLFKKFNDIFIKSNDIEYEIRKFYTDEEAIQIIQQVLKEENLMDIQNYNKTIQKQVVKKILTIQGIRISQIERIIGINRKMIQRVAKEN